MDREQKDGFLLSIWQAIALVGDVRERSEEIASAELEMVLGEAESLLIGAVSEAARRPDRSIRQLRGLWFWKAARDTPSNCIPKSGSTSVIPFPGPTTSKSSSSSLDEGAVPRAGTQPRDLNPMGVKAGTGCPLLQRR